MRNSTHDWSKRLLWSVEVGVIERHWIKRFSTTTLFELRRYSGKAQQVPLDTIIPWNVQENLCLKSNQGLDNPVRTYKNSRYHHQVTGNEHKSKAIKLTSPENIIILALYDDTLSDWIHKQNKKRQGNIKLKHLNNKKVSEKIGQLFCSNLKGYDHDFCQI